MTSSAPSSRKRRPIAAPSPEPPPVTRMRFPLSRPFSNIVRFLRLVSCCTGIVARLQIRHEASSLTLRPKARCAHESHSLFAILPARRSRACRRARSRGRTQRGRDRDQIRGAEFLRHPDDPGQIPDQAAVSVLAGGRSRRRDRKRRPGRDRSQGRRSRGGVLRPQWRTREDRAAGEFDREDSRQSGFRSRRRHHHHLRHRAACAGRSRQPQARRNHRGAGRCRRHRPCCLRTRQADGAEGDRLRVIRREARIRQSPWRRARRSTTPRKI